jgi:hypothetical protein
MRKQGMRITSSSRQQLAQQAASVRGQGAAAAPSSSRTQGAARRERESAGRFAAHPEQQPRARAGRGRARAGRERAQGDLPPRREICPRRALKFPQRRDRAHSEIPKRA